MNLSELKEKLFIDRNLSKKREEYTDIEVKEQEEIVRIVFYILKRAKKENEESSKRSKPIDKEALINATVAEVNDVFDKTKTPTLSDFYKRETFEYILQHKEEVRKVVEQYIKNNTKFQEKDIFHYTVNIEKNINEMVLDVLGVISSTGFVNSEKFNKIREKIATNTLSLEDVDYLTDLVIRQIENFAKKEKTVQSDIKSNVDDVCQTAIKHVKKSMVESKECEKDIQQLYPGRTSFYVQGQTLTTPFFSSNKESNYEIFINQLMSQLDFATAQRFADFTLECAKSKDVSPMRQTIKTAVSILKNDTIEDDYKKRIISLLEYLEMHQELHKFIDTHNAKLDKIGIEALKIADEESLKSIIENLDNNSRDSFEVLAGLSAFYCNRMTKLIPQYARVAYILNKYDAFTKLSEDDSFDLDEIEIKEDDLRTYMAEYDIIGEEVNNEAKKAYKTKKLYSDPEKTILETEENIKGKSSKFNEIDGINFEDDIELVFNASVISAFYEIKNEGVRQLIYMALNDEKSSIINWGYVKGDRNEDSSRILIGFDIRSLNMPLFFHMEKSDIREFIRSISGDTKIPVYKGGNDMDLGFDNITTQIAYPLSKKKKKELKKSSCVSYAKKFLNHIQWLQDGKSVPDHLKDEPNEVYNMETGKIELAQNNDRNSSETPEDVDL